MPQIILDGTGIVPVRRQVIATGMPQLMGMGPKERTQALERFRILQPCIENDVPLTHVARHHGLPLRTVQRWLAQYRSDPIPGVILLPSIWSK